RCTTSSSFSRKTLPPVRNGKPAEVQRAPHLSIFQNQLLGIYRRLHEGPADQRPVHVIQSSAVHTRYVTVSESQHLAAQSAEAHRWCGRQLKLQRQRQDRPAEFIQSSEFRARRHLHHHSVLQVRAEQATAASLDRLPGVRL